MINFEMLLVKPNNPQEKGRMSSDQIHVKLANMLNKCENEDYVSRPAAWCSRFQTIDEVVEMDITDTDAEVLRSKRLPHYGGLVQEHLQPSMLEVPNRRQSGYFQLRTPSISVGL